MAATAEVEGTVAVASVEVVGREAAVTEAVEAMEAGGVTVAAASVAATATEEEAMVGMVRCIGRPLHAMGPHTRTHTHDRGKR